MEEHIEGAIWGINRAVSESEANDEYLYGQHRADGSL